MAKQPTKADLQKKIEEMEAKHERELLISNEQEALLLNQVAELEGRVSRLWGENAKLEGEVVKYKTVLRTQRILDIELAVEKLGQD